MLPRVDRLVKSTDFRLAMRRGLRTRRTHLVAFQFLRNVDEPARVGFVVPKKQVRLATRRNLVKRRMREIAHLNPSLFPWGSLNVILAKSGVENIGFQNLEIEITSAFDHLQSKQDQAREGGKPLAGETDK